MAKDDSKAFYGGWFANRSSALDSDEDFDVYQTKTKDYRNKEEPKFYDDRLIEYEENEWYSFLVDYLVGELFTDFDFVGDGAEQVKQFFNEVDPLAYDEIEMIIESIVENGVYFSPEPFTNLPFALKKMNQAYTRSKLDGVPEDRLSLMRRYISECQNLLSKAMQAEQQQQMAMMQAQTAAQQQAQQQSAPQLEGVSSQQTAPSLAAI